MRKYGWIVILWMGAMWSCIDPYTLPGVDANETLLVVDGRFDILTGEGIVRLTRSIPLDNPGSVPVESGAYVELESSNGELYPFVEVGQGIHQISGVPLEEDPEYRVVIRTSDGSIYQSDYSRPPATPPIDSITYTANAENGLQLSVTTHDPTGQVRFYRWDYVETAEYRSAFRSNWIYDPVSELVVLRDETNDIYTCWKSEPSTRILVATTSNLAQTIVSKFPLLRLEANSWKHSVKYSLLVRQSAIDLQEYTYWNEMRKITESVGSIFDPQPSRVLGNIRGVTDPSETVLGYFSVSSVVESRIFIKRQDLPFRSRSSPFDNCYRSDIDTVLLEEFFLSAPYYTIYETYMSQMGTLLGYLVVDESCADCRRRIGGQNVRPDFWE